MILSTEYPFWLILICVLIAGALSWFLYQKNKLEISSKVLIWLLQTFRFLSIFIIAFLVLGPLLKMITRKVEKPIVFIALDNSESIIANKDSAHIRSELPKLVGKLQNELQNDFDLRFYTFGAKILAGSSLNYTEKQTDISTVFREVSASYSDRNLGAVIIATDGIYNEGSNPLYPARDLKTSIFTIALGDTIQHKDLLIQNVKHNQIVYQGNKFPLQVDFKAFGCLNQNTILSVSHQGEMVFSQPVHINASGFFLSVPITLEAKESGMQHYVITLSKIEGETVYSNNHADVFINVISGKQKILLLSCTPHPDVSAYRQCIENNQNFQVDVQQIQNAKVPHPEDYSLVILHQLPGIHSEGGTIIRQLQDKKIPLLYILGQQTGFSILNSIEPGVNFNINPNSFNDALPIMNPNFSLFSLSDEEGGTIKKFPPLQTLYGQYKIKNESEILFKQQIGNVKTDLPLIFFTKNAGSKNGFICGEGFWKWRLYDTELSKQQTTQDIIGKIIQYLAAKEDKSLFRVTPQFGGNNKNFNETEPVKFDAEVYNESYELNHQGDVLMIIKNPSGKAFNFNFSKNEKSYSLDAGIMPVGNYNYEALVMSPGSAKPAHSLRGSFIVKPMQEELMQTVADHQLLNQLSVQNEGKMLYLNEQDELIKLIKNDEKIKPIIYNQDEIKTWLSMKWIFYTIIALLSVEWFIRKWNGAI